MTSTFGSRNKITDLGDRKKIVDLGRGKIYLGEGKAKVFLTKEEIGDLCYSFLLMADSKELRYKTESLFDLLSEVEEDLKWGSNGRGVLKLENGRLTLGYKNHYEDITEIAKEEGFSFWHYIHALGLERTGLAGGESPCEFRDEKPEKVSLGKKLGALGIIGLIAGVGGAGVYCSLTKNQIDKNSEKNYITLKEIAEKNNQKMIKKYIWPLNADIGKNSILEEVTDKYGQIVRTLNIRYKNDKKFVEVQIYGYGFKFEDFVKQLDELGVLHKSKTYKELYKEINLSSSSEHLDDIYSVLIPTEEFFKNKEKLVKLINQSTGIDEKIIAEDVDKLELKVEYPRLLNNVSLEIKDYNEIDVENATSPYGNTLKLEKILRNFTDEFYSEMLESTEYNEREFDKLVKSLLEKEGYTIKDLNKMKTKDVLKVLAEVVEDNVEYDEVKADLIKKRMWKSWLSTPYETLKTGKGVCSDYSFTYEGVEKVLEDDIPNLRKVIVTRNRGANDHEWNNIMYFDGDKLIISPVDLTWDDADGIPLGSKNNNTLSDFSAIDNYHCFSKK